ncbi:hypothetical protein QR680_000691 [Steinernema hermaphroditum]|uniref:Uncharacterized protein n=1 Tax=Steinernema hermaphroditum TaxID=289476 RepID=A0AA39GW97_9BILA|nr:hypothetical protein QR680_000691 [Steinernema hermaphroditum]
MFRLTERRESLSRPDSIYHLFAYRRALVTQVFVRHLLVAHKDCTENDLCALLVTAAEGARGEMRVFIFYRCQGEDDFVRRRVMLLITAAREVMPLNATLRFYSLMFRRGV